MFDITLYKTKKGQYIMADLVVDSSIIIGIAKLYKDNIQSPRNRRENYLFNIKNLIEDGKINCIVTPTIMKEIRRGSKFDNGFGLKIISRFGTQIDFDDYDQNKTIELVDAYGNYEINDRMAIENAEDSLSRNYADARIVAETAVLQKKFGKAIPLLTDNIADICDESKINIINIRHGVPKIHIHSMHTVNDAIAVSENSDETAK